MKTDEAADKALLDVLRANAKHVIDQLMRGIWLRDEGIGGPHNPKTDRIDQDMVKAICTWAGEDLPLMPDLSVEIV